MIATTLPLALAVPAAERLGAEYARVPVVAREFVALGLVVLARQAYARRVQIIAEAFALADSSEDYPAVRAAFLAAGGE